MTYDETNMRIRAVEEVNLGEDRDYYDVLYLHNIVSNLQFKLTAIATMFSISMISYVIYNSS